MVNLPQRRTARPGAGTHSKRDATLLDQARQGLEAIDRTKRRRRRAPTIIIASSPPTEAMPFVEEETPEEQEEEEEEHDEEEHDEEVEEVEEKKEQELEYRGSWIALVNGKIELPGSQTGK
jgi:hypothetical protein